MNTFFKAQFNNNINRLHERCLRVVHNNNLSTFDEFLELDNSVSIYHRNLQCLAIELYTMFNGISPDIMKNIFPLNTSSIYDIRNRETFYIRPVKSVYKDTESLSFS